MSAGRGIAEQMDFFKSPGIVSCCEEGDRNAQIHVPGQLCWDEVVPLPLHGLGGGRRMGCDKIHTLSYELFIKTKALHRQSQVRNSLPTSLRQEGVQPLWESSCAVLPKIKSTWHCNLLADLLRAIISCQDKPNWPRQILHNFINSVTHSW